MLSSLIVAALSAPLGLDPTPPRDALVEVQTIDWFFKQPHDTTTLSFIQFDDHAGTRTLESVAITMTAVGCLNLQVENSSDEPLPGFAVTLFGSIDASAPGAGLSITYNLTVPVPLGAHDDRKRSGPDFFDFGDLSDGGTDSTFASDLAPYLGAGTVAIDVGTAQSFLFSSQPEILITTTQSLTSGKVTLTYLYTQIPQPSSATVLTLGVLISFRRRRSR